MHFLVTITPTYEAGNALDAGPGGPRPLIEWIAQRYKPETFWVDGVRRSASWIIDLNDVGQLHELVHVALRRAGVEPVFTPILLGSPAGETIAAAVAAAATAP